MEEFEYLVNACLNSKISGQFVMRSGVKIPSGNIVPLDPKSPYHVDNGGSWAYETIPGSIVEMYLTKTGHVMPERVQGHYRDTEMDIVDFIKDEDEDINKEMKSNNDVSDETEVSDTFANDLCNEIINSVSKVRTETISGCKYIIGFICKDGSELSLNDFLK
jgi:hypothetical protein